MAMRYATKKKKMGFGDVKEERYVSHVVRDNNVDITRMIEQVSLRCGQPKAVCRAVIDTVVESMMTWMADGRGCRIGSLGILKPTISCVSGQTSSDVKVRRKKILFYPSTELRDLLAKIPVEKVTIEGSNGEDEDAPAPAPPTA